MAKIAKQANARSRLAARKFSALVAQGFFLPFAVVCLALVSHLAELSLKFEHFARVSSSFFWPSQRRVFFVLVVLGLNHFNHR